MKRAFSLVLSGCAALAWLLPTPGGRGVAAGLGMAVVLAWVSHLDWAAQDKVLSAVCAAVFATACRTQPLALAASIMGIVTLAASGGSIGVIALGAGGLCSACSGRLEPAALMVGLVAVARGHLSPRRSVLVSATVLGLLGCLGSALAGHGIPVAPRSSRAIGRSALARVLDASNSGVVARSVYSEAVGSPRRSFAHSLDRVDELERRAGITAVTRAIRIVSTAVAGGDARARVAEAMVRTPAAMDSLEAWNDQTLPWRMLASCLHLRRPPVSAVPWPSAGRLSADPLSAEYAARLLQDVGLEAEACTLASLPQWRERGWARYIVWKAQQPWEAPRTWVAVGRVPHQVPEGQWLLGRGQPARGMWPVCRICDERATQEITLRSEDWTLEHRVVEKAGWISLMNDLRAPGEDRNADIACIERFDTTWFIDSLPAIEAFRQRLVERLTGWGAPGEPRDDALPAACLAATEEVPSSWPGAVRVEMGWMLPGPGHIGWQQLRESAHLLVMRGQPAADRWPIVEVDWQGHTSRLVVDSYSWTCYPFVFSSNGSVTVRFVNDFWDPGAGQDRNLWIAGLFVDPSQARTHASR